MSPIFTGLVIGALLPLGLLFQIAAAVRTNTPNDRTLNNVCAMLLGLSFYAVALVAWAFAA